VKSRGLTGLAAGRLEELAARYGLDAPQRAQLETILLALAADEHAPTTVRDPAQAVDVHLADSLVALEVDELAGTRTIVDLGAGAGFPGLALAVAMPGASVCMVESQARKCRFVEGVCAAAALVNAGVVCTRAEEWAAGLGANDAVLARALAPAPVVLEYAAPLLRVGGTLVEWRGQRDPEGERTAREVAEVLGMEQVEIRRVAPHEHAREHHLHVYLKRRETPSRFPRRAGVARKRPLGG
jgi:16S rRNA (guanine527-N7)-methyltransferase